MMWGPLPTKNSARQLASLAVAQGKGRMGSQSKSWLWTYFPQESEVLESFIETHAEKFTYIIAGEELCPSNGKRHFQGFVYCDHRMRLRTVKELFGEDSMHIGDEYGKPCVDISKSIEYCKKDGKWIERGEPPKTGSSGGQKRAWEGALEKARKGQVLSIFDERPDFVRYMDTFYKYGAKFSRPENRNTLDNFWIWGETGSGKSRYARELEGIKLYEVSEFGRFMWQNYDPSVHEAVLVDDVRYEDMSNHLRMIKIICDHYSFQVETKGGSLGHIRPLRIYFTSLKCLKDCVPSDHYDEFARRFKEIKLTKPS